MASVETPRTRPWEHTALRVVPVPFRAQRLGRCRKAAPTLAALAAAAVLPRSSPAVPSVCTRELWPKGTAATPCPRKQQGPGSQGQPLDPGISHWLLKLPYI